MALDIGDLVVSVANVTVPMLLLMAAGFLLGFFGVIKKVS